MLERILAFVLFIPMARSRLLLWIAGTLLVLILILALFVVFFDWNLLRGPIMRKVTEETGRQLVINGDLKVRLGWPLLHVHVDGVTFANPAWAKERQMATVQGADFSVDIPSLLHRRLHLPDARLYRPAVFLEINQDGRKNWLLDKNQKDEKTKTSIPIDRLTVDQGRIGFDDDRESTSIRAEVSTQNTQQQTSQTGIIFTVTGQYKKLPLTVKGSGGPVLALEDQTLPYPLKVDARIGKSGITADGRITSLSKLSAIDMIIDLNGASLALLYPLLGIALPETGPYSTKGHLIHNGQMWRYEGFSGRIGKSDVAGTVQLDKGDKRPFLHGELNFNLLNFSDLGPVVGTQATSDITVDKENAPPPPAKTKGRVLPRIPFKAKRWSTVDADVKFNAKRIQPPRQLPIENLTTHFQMRDALLTLDPLDFGIAGGHLAGTISLDGRQEPIQAHTKLKISKFALNRMFPSSDLKKTNIGQINGVFDLTGKGDAVADMLASSNGKLSLIIGRGEISRLMMEAVGLHILEILQLKLTGDEPINIHCGVADFNVKNGVMNTNLLLLDTDITSIFGDGTINLSNEKMNMTINQKTRKTSPIALTSPIYIQGTFGDPDVHLDAKRMAAKGLGAIALGAIAPLLALIPLIDPDQGFENECSNILHSKRATTPAVKSK